MGRSQTIHQVLAALESAPLSIAPQPNSALCIRPAHPSDKDAVLAFCSHTWDDQKDYIDSVWDRWLADDRSIMLVATLNSIPVAMGRGLLVGDREAWLEGIRVDRRYRRQGIFRQLEAKLYDYLQKHGARVCRTCIASNNEVMTAIALRSNYRVVTPYTIYSGPSITSPSISSPPIFSQARTLCPSSESEINQWSDRQSTAPLYVYRGAKWQALTAEQLGKLQQRDRLWSFHYNGKFTGLFVQSEMENPDGSLWVGLCDVWGHEAVFYQELRRLSDRLGFQSVSGFFPANVMLHAKLLRAGYRRSIPFQYIVYQCQIG
ncbi:MAG: GNAT family N-acetyltransferase [Cyanobacteria bacterium P01_E01_bin.45]